MYISRKLDGVRKLPLARWPERSEAGMGAGSSPAGWVFSHVGGEFGSFWVIFCDMDASRTIQQIRIPDNRHSKAKLSRCVLGVRPRIRFYSIFGAKIDTKMKAKVRHLWNLPFSVFVQRYRAKASYYFIRCARFFQDFGDFSVLLLGCSKSSKLPVSSPPRGAEKYPC